MAATGSLRPDQIADLACYIQSPKMMNLSDPGTGKTPSVCVYQFYLWDSLGVGSVWIQPKGLMSKNRREILRFTNFKPEDVVIVDGSPAEIKAQLASGAKVFLMGFRRWTLSYKDLPAYVRAVQIDESHRGFKNPNSSASLALEMAFKNQMEYFLPMTGTLISGKLESAYMMIRIIEPRYYLSYQDFLNQHAVYNDDGKIIGWQNHAKLSRILGRHGIRRTFKDLFGEQEIVEQTTNVDMTSKQRENYVTFEKEALLELEKFFISGTEPGVSFIRARQILEHPNQFPDLTEKGKWVDIMPGEAPGKELVFESDLEDHVETGMPLIVYSPLVPQQERLAEICRKMKVSYRLINGSVPMKERDQIDLDFQAGKFQVLIASPQCCDVGYSWQFIGDKELDHIIFMTADWLDSTINQAIGRAVRGPRTTPLRVTYYRYADAPVDCRVFEIATMKSIDAHLVDQSRRIITFGLYDTDGKEAA